MKSAIEQLQERIAQVDADIKKLQQEAGNDKGAQALSDYREYLTDELKMLREKK